MVFHVEKPKFNTRAQKKQSKEWNSNILQHLFSTRVDKSVATQFMTQNANLNAMNEENKLIRWSQLSMRGRSPNDIDMKQSTCTTELIREPNLVFSTAHFEAEPYLYHC